MNYLIVDDCKETVLNDEVWKDSIDYGLFHLTPERRILDREIFNDCTFVDLFINHKVEWGAPIPSTFQAFFPDLMKFLVPEEEILLFNLVDLFEAYFEENEFIADFLVPDGYEYFFLNKEISGKTSPRLFFECPVDRVNILNDVAFPGMDVDVDGFVLKRSDIDGFKKLSNQGNTDVMFRKMIKAVYLAFGIWGDHNGMFIVTDKFDIPTLEKKLLDAPLERQIEKYIQNFNRG